MRVKNKIHDRALRPKLRAAYQELHKLIFEKGVVMKQKKHLFDRMLEYKELYEQYLSASKKENSSNTSELNAWSKKDNSDVFKEKNARILALEGEVGSLLLQIKELEEDSKRLKIKEDISSHRKYIQELEGDLRRKNAMLVDTQHDMENIQLEYKNAIEKYESIIRDYESKTSPGSLNTTDSRQESVSEILEDVHRLNEEVGHYKEKILSLKKQVAVQEKANKILKDENNALREMVAVYEERKAHAPLPDDIECNNVERVLKSELNSIVAAFDKSTKVNIALESKLSSLNNKYVAIFDENASLKNKLKEFESHKTAIEKEKRRLEAITKEIADGEKARMLNKDNHDTQIKEKDNKIADYRNRLFSMESKIKLLQKENENIKTALKALQETFKETSKAKEELEIEMKKFRAYTSINNNGDENTYQDTLQNDLEIYRKALRCSLCDLNFKNCAITKCMHCFCEDCINLRFKARNRKCPSCEIEFNMNDVKKLYL